MTHADWIILAAATIIAWTVGSAASRITYALRSLTEALRDVSRPSPNTIENPIHTIARELRSSNFHLGEAMKWLHWKYGEPPKPDWLSEWLPDDGGDTKDD